MTWSHIRRWKVRRRNNRQEGCQTVKCSAYPWFEDFGHKSVLVSVHWPSSIDHHTWACIDGTHINISNWKQRRLKSKLAIIWWFRFLLTVELSLIISYIPTSEVTDQTINKRWSANETGSLGPDFHHRLSGYPLAALEAQKHWLLPPMAKFLSNTSRAVRRLFCRCLVINQKTELTLKCFHVGTWWKKSPEWLQLNMWGTWIFKQSFMAIQPVVVKIFSLSQKSCC